MEIQFKYGKGFLEANIADSNFLCSLSPNQVDLGLTGADEVKEALENPIASERLKDIVNPGEKIAVITSDITRPMPSKVVLPLVIEELKKGNIEEKDITVILALGSHRGHSEEERRMLVGDNVFDSEVTIMDSDMDRCVNLGTCVNGTPIDVFEPVANADRIVCLGNIEYHYFAGYSGGLKAIMPGVSSHRAIQANHSNMIEERACAGNLESNPVRQDIDEVGKHLKVDFILNVVLDNKKKIVKAVAGNSIIAHREGCRFLDSMYGVEFQNEGDIVIVSPGGFPKDINIYQAQKAISNATHAVRKGGIMIVVASAKEKFGEKTFEEWMMNKSPDDMIIEIKKNFKLGGHKAAAIAMTLKKCQIYFVSDLDDELVEHINFIPFKDLQSAVDCAVKELGEDSSIMLMPDGGSTLPKKKAGAGIF